MEEAHMNPDSDPAAVPARPQRRGRGAAVMVGVFCALLIGAGVAYVLTRREASPQVVTPPAPVVTAPAPEAAAPPKMAPIEGSEPSLREWVARLSLPSVFSPFFEGGDLARRIVSAVWTVSQGEVPRPLLDFLRPKGLFEVETRKDGTRVIARSSFARYDAVTAAFAQLDMKTLAQAWRALEPVFETAHREIAPPGRTVRQTLDNALNHLLAVQVPTGDVEVVPGEGALWAFRDADLEHLSHVQKQLVRMGPDNAHTIQRKLREFRQELGRGAK
ncbi:MAG: DUF3014 domain-containing protein [Myxococcaceae bacterium]|nr:DUF3014 domain-containing protein [Myxococcaceae bacterium]